MIALIQRVSSASVTCEGVVTASIGCGLLILLGIEEVDNAEDIAWLAPKVANLRIFPDGDGVMNVSLKDRLAEVNSSPCMQGEVAAERSEDDGGGLVPTSQSRPPSPSLHSGTPPCKQRGEFPEPFPGAIVVSQFTLHASTKKGNRPSYIRAARPDHAEPLYEAFAAALSQELGQPVGKGVFGGDMKVALVNDGPVTIHIDTRNRA